MKISNNDCSCGAQNRPNHSPHDAACAVYMPETKFHLEIIFNDGTTVTREKTIKSNVAKVAWGAAKCWQNKLVRALSFNGIKEHTLKIAE